MNDYQILGLSQTFSLKELKKAFRKKSKSFHPDVNDDSYKSHLAMIRLNQAYANLIRQLEKSDTGPDLDEPEIVDEQSDYDIYREGIRHFQGIHPSKWKKIKDIYNSSAIDTSEDVLKIINDLIDSMAKAYHCFSKVIAQYPHSCWRRDCREKLSEIEKMTVRYAKIKQSYQAELT